MRTPHAFLPLIPITLCACSASSKTGLSGQVEFRADSCGAVVSGLLGCDLGGALAVGGLVDVHAVRKRDGRTLAIESRNGDIIKVVSGSAGASVLGVGPGRTELVARDVQEVDRLPIEVAVIAQIAYSGISGGMGTWRANPGGGYDGAFAVRSGVKRFTLIFGQLDAMGRRLIGRESFTYELSPGLKLARDNPPGLELEFERPAPGIYSLLIAAKEGDAGYRMQISVTD